MSRVQCVVDVHVNMFCVCRFDMNLDNWTVPKGTNGISTRFRFTLRVMVHILPLHLEATRIQCGSNWRILFPDTSDCRRSSAAEHAPYFMCLFGVLPYYVHDAICK